ncbi:MAG TPA: ubiquinol-cytochrome c reductase iron-sulfur subunit [Chloroflexota bacterium]|nr:ubiquinol-cytochrome c reductase iron-sulfur subunit [Chloroflexota bacterium]
MSESESDSQLEEEAVHRGLSPSRRRLLELLSYALGATAAGLVAIPIVGAYIAPLLNAPRGVWRTLGKVTSYPIGTYVQAIYENPSPVPWAGDAGKNAVWLRRDRNNSFMALDMYCQHLGCPVRWEAVPQMFFCPCHGGVYYANGTVAAGPPPRPLQRYPTRVRGGMVQVYTEKIPLPG